jgi:hypothetical protein
MANIADVINVLNINKPVDYKINDFIISINDVQINIINIGESHNIPISDIFKENILELIRLNNTIVLYESDITTQQSGHNISLLDYIDNIYNTYKNRIIKTDYREDANGIEFLELMLFFKIINIDQFKYIMNKYLVGLIDNVPENIKEFDDFIMSRISLLNEHRDIIYEFVYDEYETDVNYSEEYHFIKHNNTVFEPNSNGFLYLPIFPLNEKINSYKINYPEHIDLYIRNCYKAINNIEKFVIEHDELLFNDNEDDIDMDNLKDFDMDYHENFTLFKMLLIELPLISYLSQIINDILIDSQNPVIHDFIINEHNKIEYNILCVHGEHHQSVLNMYILSYLNTFS